MSSLVFEFLLVSLCSSLATSNYEYKKDEYVTISND